MEACCVDSIEEYSDDRLAALLPVPAADANKYSRGVLTLVAGAASYPGAACLAAAAAQRAGAGYVQVITAPENVRTVQAFRPSLVARSWDGWMGEVLHESEFVGFAKVAKSPEPVEAAVEVASSAAFAPSSPLRPSIPGRPCAYVVGPGFAPDDSLTAKLALFVLRQAEAPVLVDGGGLAAVATDEGRALLLERAERGLATVLTPHGGEAARLAAPLGLAAPDRGNRGDYPELVECVSNPSAPKEYAVALSQAYGATVVLKGPDTYVAHGTRVAAMREGTPALAKAGTGDVLAGVVGALLAQGIEAFDAALLGAVLHARAAKAAETRLTSICVTPEDVVEAIPLAVKTLLPA